MGDPGVGKTAKLTALARAEGYHTEVVVGSNRQPEDFLGLPTEVDGTTSYLDVDWARRAVEAEKAVVMFDEFNTGGDVFKAMLRALGERTVGNLELPDTVSMIAAANPIDVAVDGVDLAPPIANRFVHLDWWFDADEWLGNVTTGFANVTYPSMQSMLGEDSDTARLAQRAKIVGYLAQSRDRLNPGVPDDMGARTSAYPSPRSWTYAMNLIAELRPDDLDAIETAATGAVGRRDAQLFMAWMDKNDLYDPQWAMGHPDEVEFTDPRVDRIYSLMLAVESIGVTDERKWEPAMNLVTHCAEAGRPDVALASASRLLNRKPKGSKISARTRKAFMELLVDAGMIAAA
jgi:MoxR-like ATPase